MAKFLVETYYHVVLGKSLRMTLMKNIQNIEKREYLKFEILDVKLDSRKTKNLEIKNIMQTLLKKLLSLNKLIA